MAKQSGLHQIKGKVGEYSYYKQTGVQGGLIRSINQGLSARVKNGAEFANTRLNNQEFAAAANVAGILGKLVTPKFRPMILPMSQARMAKEILKVARENTENWGQRVVTSGDTDRLAAILSSMSKRDVNEFFSIAVVRAGSSDANISLEISGENTALMSSLGINALTAVATLFNVATGQWVPLAQEMSTGYFSINDQVALATSQELTPGQALVADEDFSISEFIPEANHSGHNIIVVVLMPERTINGVNHILQEYCSFVAFALPEVPEP